MRSCVAEAAWIEAEPHRVDRAVGRRARRPRRARCALAVAVVFTSFHQSPLPTALLLRMAGVPRIAAISEDYPGALLDVRHRNVPDDMHEVERALSLARAAGFALPPHDEGRLAMRVAAANPASGAPYVVVHPGATVPARAWSPLANRALVTALAARGDRVVVTGGRVGNASCARSSPADEALNLAGETGFETLARVIADARAIVVGNTGAAHVAAAVGTPVVSLFPPTIPAARFRPWMVPHVLLGDQTIACRGCRARVCPIEGQPCLGVVTVDDAIAALDALTRARGGRVMRVFFWHVHGSYATSLVQGGDDYFVPVLPDRGPDGRGRARTYDLAGERRRGDAASGARSRRRRRAAAASARARARGGVARTRAGARRARDLPRAQRAAGPHRRDAPPDGGSRRPHARARDALQRALLGQRNARRCASSSTASSIPATGTRASCRAQRSRSTKRAAAAASREPTCSSGSSARCRSISSASTRARSAASTTLRSTCCTPRCRGVASTSTRCDGRRSACR